MSRLRVWSPLAVILLAALLLRMGFVPDSGHESDLSWYSRRAWSMKQFGFFSVYRQHPTDAPPLYITVLGVIGAIHSWGETPFLADNPALIPIFKIVPIGAELGIIALAYAWLRRRAVWRWAVPSVIALCPPLILNTALWGQVDSLYVLIVVAALFALHHDKRWWVWGLFGVALTAKIQSVILLPLLVVVCFRRYGWRNALGGVIIAVLIVAAAVFPFAMGSGFDEALHPYFGAVGKYPVITVNAFNLWYVVTPHKFALPFPYDYTLDSQPLSASLPLSMNQAGLAALGVCTLLILCAVWRGAKRTDPAERREFVWAAALYMVFFTLPTQIHERYLYPGVVLSIVALVQERRLIFVAIGSIYTFTYNLVIVLGVPLLTAALWIPQASAAIAALNLCLLVEMMGIAVFPLAVPPRRSRLHRAAIPIGQGMITVNRFGILLLLSVLAGQILYRLRYPPLYW
ncbi:MAG TPA: glycosyltransferase 87 family protein [Aggregatilineales bacterium]|nr:DUF2029 domain-containing protein [Anaerolineales bacterium]HRE46573.1 glycosyltransferase 87 family protein [Aggregatilineales bacterium]